VVEGAQGAAYARGMVRSLPTSPPHECRAFVHKRIIGAVSGFIGGGVSGAVRGFVTKGGGSSRAGRSPRVTDQIPTVPISSKQERRRGFGFDLFEPQVPPPIQGPKGCPPGELRLGKICVALQKPQGPIGLGLAGTLPGPSTGVTSMATGRAVVGAFGLPAMVPETVGSIRRRDGSTSIIRRCGPRMVLGTDDLCYPKALLPRRSKFRKWRLPPRPAVSAGDTKAIRRAGRARDRVLQLAKDVGLHASKTRPKPAAKAMPHQHLLAAPSLRVITEETN